MFSKIKKYTFDQWLRGGVYLLIFLLPWQTHWLAKSFEVNKTFWETGSIKIYVTQIILWILIIAFLTSKSEIILGAWSFKNITKKDVMRHWWWIILGLFLASLMVNVYSSPNSSISLNIWYQFLGGLGLLLLLEKVGIDRFKASWSFVGGVLLSSCLGLYQFFSQSSFAHKMQFLRIHRAQIGLRISSIRFFGGCFQRISFLP